MLFDSVEIQFFGPFLRILLSMTTSDDKPWINREITELDRKRKRKFFKNHKSEKWLFLHWNYLPKVKKKLSLIIPNKLSMT